MRADDRATNFDALVEFLADEGPPATHCYYWSSNAGLFFLISTYYCHRLRSPVSSSSHIGLIPVFEKVGNLGIRLVLQLVRGISFSITVHEYVT
jgi:hypothetical protein